MDDETDEEGEEDEAEEEEGQGINEVTTAVTASQRQRAKEKAARLERPPTATPGPGPSTQAAAARDDDDEDMDGADALLAEAPEPEPEDAAPLSAERMDLFRTRLSTVLETSGAANDGYVDFEEMLPLVNEGLSTDDMFGSGEARTAVEKMHQDNQVMFSEGVIYKTV